MKKIAYALMITILILFNGIVSAAEQPKKAAGKKEHYWINIFPVGMKIDSLAFDPQDANTLYASIDRGEKRRGLYKSINGGNLWFPVAHLKNDNEIKGSVVKVDPTNRKVIYFGTNSGELWRSKNEGTSWENISAGVISGVNDIAINPKNPEIIYVISGETLYKTLNGGKTWGELEDGARWLYLNPDSPDELYACCKEIGNAWSGEVTMLKHSVNSGQSFELGALYRLTEAGEKERCGSWDVTFGGSEMLLACAPPGWDHFDILKSLDGGKTWELIVNRPFANFIKRGGFGGTGELKWIKLHPTDKNVVYSGIEIWTPEKHDKILKSIDGGKTWEPLPDPPFTDIKHFKISPSNIIFASTSQGVFKSVDEGKTWESASFGLPVDMSGRELKFVDAKSGLIYVGSNNGYWTSNDMGFSWKWSQVEGLKQIIVANDQTIFIGRGHSLSYWEWRLYIDKITQDKGLSEIKIGGVFPKNFAVSPSNSQILYVLGDKVAPRHEDQIGGQILLKSEDGGFSWTEIRGAWNKITLLSVDPKSPDVVYIAADNGRFLKTTDGGKTWADITRGVYQSITTSLQSVWTSSKWLNPAERADMASLLASSSVSSLVIDPSNSNIVYVTTLWGGVYRSDDGGKTWKSKSPTPYLKILAVAFDNYSAQQCKGKKGCKVTLDITLQKKGKGQFFIQTPPNTVIVDPKKIVFGLGFYFRNVSIDPSNSKIIYLATGDGVYRSHDRGDTWQLLDQGLLDRGVKKVIATPTAVLAEGESGIYKLFE